MKFETEPLRERVKAKRSEHRREFEKAMDRYRNLVTKELDEILERLGRGERVTVVSRWPIPEEHTADYDNVVDMLEHTMDSQIELTPERREEWSERPDDVLLLEEA